MTRAAQAHRAERDFVDSAHDLAAARGVQEFIDASRAFALTDLPFVREVPFSALTPAERRLFGNAFADTVPQGDIE